VFGAPRRSPKGCCRAARRSGSGLIEGHDTLTGTSVDDRTDTVVTKPSARRFALAGTRIGIDAEAEASVCALKKGRARAPVEHSSTGD